MFMMIAIAVLMLALVFFAFFDGDEMSPKDKLQGAASAITAATAIISVIFTGYQLEQQNKNTGDSAQANQIAVWVKPDISTDSAIEYIHISNTSSQPIYDVAVSIDEVDERSTDLGKYDETDCKFIQCVPAGEYKVELKNQKEEGKEYNASISFRDANGQNWYRNAAGSLRKSGGSKWVRDIPDAVTSAEFEVDVD